MARVKVRPEEDLGSDSPPVSALTGEQRAGVNLAYIVLGAIILLMLCNSSFFFSFHPKESINDLRNLSEFQMNDTIYSRKIETIQLISQEQKEYREFISKNLQFAIGILIPILTSILGYIFGTRAKG